MRVFPNQLDVGPQGLVITPTTSIQAAVNQVGGIGLPASPDLYDCPGGVILLGEGIWDIYKTITIPYKFQGVSIVSMCPSKSILRRKGNWTGPLIRFESYYSQLVGVRIRDESTTETSVEMAGIFQRVHNCTILGAQPLHFYGTGGRVTDNMLYFNGGVSILGALLVDGDRNIIANNNITPFGGPLGYAIYGDDGSSDCTYMGNMYQSGVNVLSYKSLVGNQEYGNIGNVTARP